jgi:hypothetical protein
METWKKVEIEKCSKDPLYFISNYVRLKLYDYQSEIIEASLKNHFVIIRKERQLGISTLVSAYALWFLLFKSQQRIAVLAMNQKMAAQIVHNVKRMFNTLQGFLREEYTIEIDNQYEFRIKQTDSTIKALSKSNYGYETSISLLLIDEAAYIEDLNWLAIYPCLAPIGSCIAFSNPHKVKNWFDTTYEKASKNEENNEFYPIDLRYNIKTTNQKLNRLIEEMESKLNEIKGQLTVLNSISLNKS